MEKKEAIDFIDKAIAERKSIVLTAQRGDITFPLPISKDSLNIIKNNLINGYTKDLERRDKLYKIIDIDLEKDYCKKATEEKIRQILTYFKTNMGGNKADDI